jgi:hypothetical protein
VIDFTLSQLVMRIVAVLVVSTLHGLGIAAAAVALGDAGPRHDGRLTLNPLAHVDLLGGAVALIFAAGWGRWVAIDPRGLRHGYVDLLLVVAAGVLAIVLGVEAFRLCRPLLLPLLPDTAAATTFTLIQTMIEVALAFALLSLLPVPPLAAGHLVVDVLPSLHERLPQASFIVGVIVAAAMFAGSAGHLLDPAVRFLVSLALGEDVGM